MDALKEQLIKNLKIKKIGATYIGVMGRKVTHDKFVSLIVNDYSDFAGDISLPDFKKTLSEISEEYSKSVEYNLNTDLSVNMSEVDIEKYCIATELKTADKFVFDAASEDILFDMSVDVFRDIVPKDFYGLCVTQPVPLKFVYDPYNLTKGRREKVGFVDALVYNTYQPPSWRSLEVVPKCHSIFQKLLNHLFPVPEQQEYVLNWVHHAMTSRCHTYLILNGERGIGKNLFINIVSKLVGNAEPAPDSFFTSNFNDFIKNARLIYIDEQDIGAREADRLKKYGNDELLLEEKFVAIGTKKKIYASFIISNNSRDQRVYTRWDERRFSVLDLGVKPLSSVMSEEELHYLASTYPNDEERIAELGYYILEMKHYLKFGTEIPYKGERFWELVVESLPSFKRFVVEKIMSKESDSYSFNKLKREFAEIKSAGEKGNHLPVIKKFLENNFRYRGEQIATVEGENIIPTDDYKPTTENIIDI